MFGPGGMGPGPRGMMMPRPGVPMIGMGRGGFPPMGPPIDMYYYNPYMGEGMGFYGNISLYNCKGYYACTVYTSTSLCIDDMYITLHRCEYEYVVCNVQ